VKRVKRKWTAAEKAKHAKLRKSIEAEFPPGSAVPRAIDPTQPANLQDYFDLRLLVAELRKAREAQGLSLADQSRYRAGQGAALL